eukprot:m.185937 g.185937  ORF g.185937 m.185937 type:complete len:634 (-) comp16606_c0_seq1:93-1994(-)
MSRHNHRATRLVHVPSKSTPHHTTLWQRATTACWVLALALLHHHQGSMIPTADAKLWLGTPPMGWEDFDSYMSAAYNESYIRSQAMIQAQQLLPSGYDIHCIGGWSVGGLLLNGSFGPPDPNRTHQYTNIDEFGRPVPDSVRFPSAVAGGGDGTGDCTCDERNCTDPQSWMCTDPVCICKVGTRTLKPFATFLNTAGLRLGLWTWRGVHRAAVAHKLQVPGTPYTMDQIVNQNPDGTPCTQGRCAGACDWLPTLGINGSHPGAQPFYDALYGQFADWMVEFVKADCMDHTEPAETMAQANAVKKLPLIPGTVHGSTKERTMALSLSPDAYGGPDTEGVLSDANFLASNQAATMYRITTDFHGGGRVFASTTTAGGGSIDRVRQYVDAGLIGANGTFPDLDMLAVGRTNCPNDTTTACSCNSCNGTGLAYTILATWAFARSPLLAGGQLPLDPITLSLHTNPDLLYIHAAVRNHTVMEYYQVNQSCTQTTKPPCDWTASGWIKMCADLLPPAPRTTTTTSTTTPLSSASSSPSSLHQPSQHAGRPGTAATAANPPIKAVLIVDAGPVVPGQPPGRLTLTTWESLGLGGEGAAKSESYAARDVFSQHVLPSNASGFVTNVTGLNATLVLVYPTSP